MAMNSAMDTTELLGGFEQVRKLIKLLMVRLSYVFLIVILFDWFSFDLKKWFSLVFICFISQ